MEGGQREGSKGVGLPGMRGGPPNLIDPNRLARLTREAKPYPRTIAEGPRVSGKKDKG